MALHPQGCRLGLQLLLQGAGADDDDRVIGTLHSLQKDVQALVIAHHSNEQEEALPHRPPPVFQASGIGLRIAGLVQAIGDEFRLVLIAAQHLAGAQVVRRRGDNAVGLSEESMHQRLVELEQMLLTNDVRVVGHHPGLADPGEEMDKVHERPGKVVVDDVCFGRQLAKMRQHAVGEPGGGELQVQAGTMHPMAVEMDDARPRIRAQGQHIVVDTVLGATAAHLVDDLADASYRIRQIGLVEM
ncbi:hypothetical protein D3C84_616100 [compost metagenome]